MEITFTGAAIVFTAGFAGGFVNTVSAAGSLITLPALQFAGLTPQCSNATNRIGVLLHNFASIQGYRSKGLVPDKHGWMMAMSAMPGAMLGAFFSVKIPDAIFNKLLALVILLFLALMIFFPIKTRQNDEETDAQHHRWGYVGYFFAGIYGGFLQAGTGFLLMATTIYINKFGLLKTNLYKALAMLMYTTAALVIFVWKGNIHWMYGLIVSLGFFAGGFITSRWSTGLSEEWIKRIVMVLVLSMALKLWFF